MAKTDEIESLTMEERQKRLKKKRSNTEKIKRKFLADGGTLKPGQGKGKEPDPLCECHNRNPCPIDIELSK